MPARDYGPPPGLLPEERVVWAVKQIETATCEGEIRAAVRVFMQKTQEPHRLFVLYIRRDQLQALAELQAQVFATTGRKPKMGELAQEALDLYIATARGRNPRRSNE
jgi:hypothetical protein